MSAKVDYYRVKFFYTFLPSVTNRCVPVTLFLIIKSYTFNFHLFSDLMSSVTLTKLFSILTELKCCIQSIDISLFDMVR